jgi:hypothetical protein
VVETYLRFVIQGIPDTTNSNVPAAITRNATLDRAFAAVGPLFVGYYDSIFAYQAAALSLDGNINADPQVDQISSTTPGGRGRSPSPRRIPRLVHRRHEHHRRLPEPRLRLHRDLEERLPAGRPRHHRPHQRHRLGAQLSGSLGSGTQPQIMANLAYSETHPSMSAARTAWSLRQRGRVVVGAALGPGQPHQGVVDQRDVELSRRPLDLRVAGCRGVAWAPTTTALVSAELLYVNNAGADSLSLHTQLKSSFGNDN